MDNSSRIRLTWSSFAPQESIRDTIVFGEGGRDGSVECKGEKKECNEEILSLSYSPLVRTKTLLGEGVGGRKIKRNDRF